MNTTFGIGAAFALLSVAFLATATADDACAGLLYEGLGEKLKNAGDKPVVALAVHTEGQTPAAMAALDRAGIPHSDAPRVGVSQLLLTEESFAAICDHPAFDAFFPESRLELYLAESTRIIRAVEAREALGEDGKNAVVLMIDTGADGSHPDFQGQIHAVAQPYDPLETGLVPEGYVENVPANDWFGHGTHVLGTIVGTGAGVAPQDPMHGQLVGVAPGAKSVVYSIPGLGNAETVFQGVQGFEYALEKQEEYKIRVITNSWGQVGNLEKKHPITVATRKAYEAGMAVVFAAGNSGEANNNNPVVTNKFGAAPWVIMVASSTKDGAVSDFSSRGSERDMKKNPWNRPDVIAPGSQILAAKSRMGALQATSLLDSPSGGGNLLAQATYYQYMSGTSMATPHVAGVLTLMFSANPELSPDQAYDILVNTTADFDADFEEMGRGLVDAKAAVEVAKATPGERAAFLAGAKKYNDLDNLEFDPVAALMDTKDRVSKPLQLAESTPGPGALWALLLVALGAFVLRRRT